MLHHITQYQQRRGLKRWDVSEYTHEAGDHAEEFARHVYDAFACLYQMWRHPVARFGANYRVFISFEIPHRTT